MGNELKTFANIMEQLNTYQRMGESYNKVARHYGTEDEMFMTDVHIIKAIGDNSGCSLKDLAKLTYRTDPAMSMAIKDLSEREFVKRERDEKDNRKYIITLTEKGEEVYKYHEELDRKNYTMLLNALDDRLDLSEEDLNLILGVLKELNDIFRDKNY